tara:strand:- start:59673 stop:60176 length:504 start_codon:yes stop_codon:yes gene_type:complete
MEEAKTPKFKNRDQSLLEFYKALQVEYIVAELRSKIYPKAKDKRYYKDRVMQGKRDSIIQISERNHLPSIFNSKHKYDEIYREIHPDWGIPAFTYRDEESKKWISRSDKLNYYSLHSEFALKLNGGSVEICTIVNNSSLIKDSTVEVIVREAGHEVGVDISNLKRIL